MQSWNLQISKIRNNSVKLDIIDIQFNASIVIQRHIRGLLAYHKYRRIWVAIIKIQSYFRRILANKRCKKLKIFVAFKKHRYAKNLFERKKVLYSISIAMEAEILYRERLAQNEINLIEEAISFQKQRVDADWIAFDSQTSESIMKRPLPNYWLNKIHPETNQMAYYNSKTNEYSAEHPNLKFVRLNLATEHERVSKSLKEYVSERESQIETINENVGQIRRRTENKKIRDLDKKYKEWNK